ncbi:MAG: flavin reductase [Oscillospiraceae bacterium]|nr:flavin reductase [Oscillospiraceae bacterium]
MDKKALYNLSYGVFVLTTKSGDKANGCITNTCMQVANSPVRVAISVLNTNYTCDLLKESGVFALSLLDETATFDTVKHFGLQSGRDTDKLEGLELTEDCNGVPFWTKQSCGVLSCKVLEKQDLGSHTMFIAEVVDAVLTSDKAPLTYADYQSKVKPKKQAPKQEKKIKGWRCKICNYFYEGSVLPEDYLCPLCGHDKDDFEPVYED